MGSQRLTPEERHQSFLDVGLEIFGKRSFDAVSVADICDAAGVSRPLFEHYFGSKKAYYVACVAYSLDHLEQTVRWPAIERSMVDPQKYLENMFGFIREHPAGAVLLERAGGVSDAKVLVDQFNDETTERVLGTLPEPSRTMEVRTAIECWHGVNSRLISRLIRSPEMTVEWAARYSAAMLNSLIAEASTT
ncbi:MAG: helix-turn-helix domain-containing protein [Pseudomonadota bacterium]